MHSPTRHIPWLHWKRCSEGGQMWYWSVHHSHSWSPPVQMFHVKVHRPKPDMSWHHSWQHLKMYDNILHRYEYLDHDTCLAMQYGVYYGTLLHTKIRLTRIHSTPVQRSNDLVWATLVTVLGGCHMDPISQRQQGHWRGYNKLTSTHVAIVSVSVPLHGVIPYSLKPSRKVMHLH